MRDQERMKVILNLINDIWLIGPDLRFNQLIYLLQNGYSSENGNIGKVDRVEKDGFTYTGYDFFNVEDDKFIYYLTKIKNDGKL